MKIEIDIPDEYLGEMQKHWLHFMLTKEINDTRCDIDNQNLWIKGAVTEEQVEMYRQNKYDLIKYYEILRIIEKAMD